MINGCFASVPWSGACWPASCQARWRAAALAVSMAFKAAGASSASVAIARVVHFLAADAPAYITGQVWGVNGGLDM